MKPVKSYQFLVLILIFFSFLLLRLWDLTESCLFFDEIFSIHAAKHDWNLMFWFLAQDLIHPPLFYILLKTWISIGGESLLWLRLFPVVFSIIAIIPFSLLCRELKLHFWSYVLAFALFTVNGCWIKYSQEIRMYSVLLCFSIFSIWLFVRILNRKQGLVWLILINVLLVNTHYFGWLVIFSQLVSVLIISREKLKQILLMIAVTVLSFLPWVFQVWQAAQINADFKQNLGWAARPNLSTLFHFLNDLFEPFYFQQTNIDRAETLPITIPIIFIFATATVFYFLNWKKETEKEQMILLILFLKVPIISAFIASWVLPVSVWGTRHLIFIFPLIAIYFAIVLSKVRIRELKITFISLLALFIFLALVLQIVRVNQKLVWCSWEELAADLEVSANSSQTKLYVFEDLVAYHIWSALKDKEKTKVIVVKGIEGLLEDKAYFLPRGFDGIKTVDASDFTEKEIWIAFRDSKFSEFHEPIWSLLERGYKIGEPKVFEAQGVQTFLVRVWKED